MPFVGEKREHGMTGRKLEGGGDLALRRALPHQRRVAARAGRQRESIEQDRFAGAGLAGEHRQALAEFEIEPVDQNDIADRQGD